MASKDKKPDRSTSGGRPTGGIRTLADLNRHPAPDSDSYDGAPQEYYAGGEKRLLSGEMVPPGTVIRNVVRWCNGFTVDDGPLRSLDDTANVRFLETILKSECPKELEPADKTTSMDVYFFERDENYPERKKCTVAFQGVRRTLGSSSTSATSEQTAPLASAPPPCVGLVVDQTQPSTPIQLRLADGTRMVAHFNYHHTIGDIHAFIDASRPGGSTTYQLQTVGFPPKQLNDLNQTIEQAGLANSVVIQKV